MALWWKTSRKEQNYWQWRWLKKTTWLPLCLYTDFIFSAINDKSSDNASKRKAENPRLIYDEVQEDALPSTYKKIDVNQPGSLVDDTVNGYLTWRNIVEPPAACSNLEGYKFIYSNVLNKLISNTLIAKAIPCNSERCCEKRRWWTFSCLFDVYFFIRLVDKRLTDAVVGKIQNYYGAAIQSNIGKLKGYAKCHLGKIFSHD